MSENLWWISDDGKIDERVWEYYTQTELTLIEVYERLERDSVEVQIGGLSNE